jgi:glycosyltransferase involved in cell wall biosynthesis
MDNKITPTVFHVIPTLLIGGAEGMLESLLSARRETIYRQVVVNLTGEGTLRRPVPSNVQVYDLGLAGVTGVPRVIYRLAQLIRKHRPIAVQSWLYYADLISLAALQQSGLRSQTRIYWGVRSSNLKLSRYRPWLRCAIAACAFWSDRPDAVVANSFAGREVHIALGYKPRAFPVIPNGIDSQRFRPNEAARTKLRAALGVQDRIVVLHVGRLDPMKDHATLLAIARRRPHLTFLFAGADTDTLELPGNAMALGARQDVNELYTASDIYVSSSAFGEGFSNTLAEAMASGLPVVTTNVGDASQIVGTTGYVIKPGDRAGLVASIDQLAVLSETGRKRLGNTARSRIISNYTLDQASASFDDLFLAGKLPIERQVA